jgi:hypothetical protein
VKRLVVGAVVAVALVVGAAAYFGTTSRQLLLSEYRMRHITPPPLELPDPIAPETAGMKVGASSPFPASEYIFSERSYEVLDGVDGERVRMFFAVERVKDGTGAIVVLHRNNLGHGRWTAHEKIRFEYFPSPIPGGALHITGFANNHLQLVNDRGKFLAFDVRNERFRLAADL